MNYDEFLKNKIIIAEDFGFDVNIESLNPWLKPHCKDVVTWALMGGRRAIFADFGLHKTSMQLEIATQCINKTGMPFIIVCPLAVANEFRQDNESMGGKYAITYITDTETIQDYAPQIYITNYERVRMGDIDPSKFCGSSFDEASILRNLKTETTNYVIKHFSNLPYRFVATATPTPNDLIEILNYAVFLGVASRGQLLTRFFGRNPQKANDLVLYPTKKKEFWKWVSTWAAFITKPSDLGHSNEGYILPEVNIIEHCLDTEAKESYIDKNGHQVFFKDISKSLNDVSREKRESIVERCNAAYAVAKECKSAILWHHLEAERVYLEKLFAGDNSKSVFGSQPNELKEKNLSEFANGKYNYMLTKPKIAGSGCNFQRHCHDALFVGIDYKFNDFIQAIHRLLRYGQLYQVNVHIFFTKSEYEVLKVLFEKWELHKDNQRIMRDLIKECGLNKEIIKKQMERQVFEGGKKITIGNAILYNNDMIKIVSDAAEVPDNSIDFNVSSWPFGNHYEYSDNYNDVGHNPTNEDFFKQMDFATPHFLRTLKPGRIMAVHVKDRIRYSYQNGVSFTTLEDFSGQTVAHCIKHGFYLMGKITVTTDVVRENKQTNRLGWSERCKDATSRGVGSPEYILLFRKAPTGNKNARGDSPVVKNKTDYTRAQWQLDAHAYQRSGGNRFLSIEELQTYELSKIFSAWEKHNKENIYSYVDHLKSCEELDEFGKLSALFMSLPVHSNSPMVWTDINRMNTLNAQQVNKKKEKHICPLQLDIIERLINQFSNEGETVADFFGGLFSTAYVALEMERKAISVELKTEYFQDGLFYIDAITRKINMPTLFDLEFGEEKAA